jgi:hypothetical protein
VLDRATGAPRRVPAWLAALPVESEEHSACSGSC